MINQRGIGRGEGVASRSALALAGLAAAARREGEYYASIQRDRRLRLAAVAGAGAAGGVLGGVGGLSTSTPTVSSRDMGTW